jgi:hypothetical protein
MQTGNNSKDIDEANRHLKQQEMIDKVVKWLREIGYNPEDQTHRYKTTNYYGSIITKEGKLADTGERVSQEGFNVYFTKDKPDSVTILEAITLSRRDQDAYKSLAATHDGILQQNAFYFDLQLALLQKNVMFIMHGGVRELKSLEVFKGIYFDGLTKDRFAETYMTVNTAVQIARIKLRQLRDRILPSQAGQTGDDSGDLK